MRLIDINDIDSQEYYQFPGQNERSLALLKKLGWYDKLRGHDIHYALQFFCDRLEGLEQSKDKPYMLIKKTWRE